MTATQRALKIIADNGDERMTAHEFGDAMWPDSPAHNRYSRQGRGSCRGKGIWFAGGCLLGRLEKAGLICRLRWQNMVWLTNKGRKLLQTD